MMKQRAQSLQLQERLSTEAGNQPTSILLILSALAIGALLGSFAPAHEHRAIDASLVLAGIINYPPESPMSQYFFNSWTILNQLGALFLRIGLSQAQISAFFSITATAFLVCAYTMIIQGMSGRPLFSVCAASLCYLANPFAWLFASPDYPTLGLMLAQGGELHTYGLWGQIGTLWVVGCVAGGRPALAAASSLVLIAIHPILGVYMATLLIASVVFGEVFFGSGLKGYLKGAAWGAVIMAVSVIVYLTMRHTSTIHTDITAYEAYMRFWDSHRTEPITFVRAMRIGAAAFLAISVFFAFLRLGGIKRPSTIVAVLLGILAVCISTIAYFVTHLIPSALPQIALRAAPSRLLNVQAYASAPMVVGMLFYVEDHFTMERLCMLGNFFTNRGKTEGAVSSVWKRPLKLFRSHVSSYGLLVLFLLLFGVRAFLGRFALHPDAIDYSFWNSVRSAGVSGLVLTSSEASRPSIYHGHLAIALDAQSFDFVPYLPYTINAIVPILQDGYGVPFFQPPPQIQHRGGLSPDEGRSYWAQLTIEDWLKISQTLGVVAVVAPTDWLIKLPVTLRSKDFALYKIRP